MFEQFLSPETTAFDEGGELSNTLVGVSCPECRTELMLGTVHGKQFAGCCNCGGMMFQREVFAAVLGHLRANYKMAELRPAPMDASKLDVKRVCPTCSGRLETHPYAGPGNEVIDSCNVCGVVWLDQGEFTNLVRSPGRR